MELNVRAIFQTASLHHYYICITAINRYFSSPGRLERVCWRRESARLLIG
jgi:hypothetical protein